jgi:hypothetical protein
MTLPGETRTVKLILIIKNMKKEIKEEIFEPLVIDSKLKSAINLLYEKLTSLGVDYKDKLIIIKNGELTIK